MRIMLINQAFYPDVVATAQHAHDLARYLIKNGHQVTVVASCGIYGQKGAGLPRREVVDGIEIHRVGRSFFGKAGIAMRILDYAYFLFRALTKALMLPNHDVVIGFTSPPFVMLIGRIVRFFRGSKFVYWVMDIHPDLAVACGLWSKKSLIIRYLDHINKNSAKKSDATVVIGRCMFKLMESKGVPPEKMRVIGVWSDPNEIQEVVGTENQYRVDWDIGDRVLVMYSGNFGLGHNVETFLEAARLLRNDDRVRFAFVGAGKRLKEVEDFVREHALETSCILAPYQPRERLSELLNAADIHLVSLRGGIEGIMVPSKFYGILASERPAIFIGNQGSEIAQVINEDHCGFTVAEGMSEELAQGILEYVNDPESRKSAGKRGRNVLNNKYSMEHRCQQWLELLEELPLTSQPKKK